MAVGKVKALARARSLVKRFGDLVAVDGINLDIKRGECLGLLGPNGAGKTSTIRMMSCVSPATSGKLEIFGLPVDGSEGQIKQRMGVVPQENNLDPDFSSLQNLTIYARYFSIDPALALERSRRLLDEMGLSHKADANVEELSGGMKRRLILARALVNDPELLVLDEPTTGLDPQARALLWDRISAMKEKGLTILLTTHYMEEAQRLCDRIVIMDNGKILVQGRPEDLLKEHFKGDIIEIRCEGDPEAVATELRKLGVQTEVFSSTIIGQGAGPDLDLSKVLNRKDLSYRSVRSPTLEDLFLKLTGRGLRE